MDLYRVLRPLLFALPADRAHDTAQWAFRRRYWASVKPLKPELPLGTRVAGLDIPNPFGLAAGFDKNGDITATMARLGFGFIVVGSVRAAPHEGNPRPWFARRRREGGLVNSMGLPSRGAEYVRRQLSGTSYPVPVQISITGESMADLARAFELMEGVAGGWEFNLSCPNTETGRNFEEDPEAFGELLDLFRPHARSIFLKLSPFEGEEGREAMLEMGRRALRRGFKNFTLCNTLPVEEPRVATRRGGLSGRPLFPYALRAVQEFHEEFGDSVNLVGVGGIMTGQEAFEMLSAGARAVEVLTALIYRGPLVVRHLTKELVEIMVSKGYGSMEELTGTPRAE